MPSTDDPPSLGRQAASTSLWTLAGTVAKIPTAVATTVVLARLLMPSGYGRLALLTFVITATSSLGSLGTLAVFQRRVALAHGAGARAEQRDALEMTLSVAALQMGLTFLIAIAVFRGDTALWLVAGYCVVTTITTPALVLFISTNRGAAVARVSLVAAVATAAAQLSVARATHDPDLTLATSLLAGIVPHLALVRLAGPVSEALPGWRRPRLTASDWRFALMGLANGQLTTVIFNQSELMFFPASRSLERGAFAAESTVGMRASLVIDALFASVAPAVTTLRGKGEDSYRRGVETILRLSGVLFALVLPGAIAGATFLTPFIFPSSFGDLRGWVIPLIAISLLQTTAQPILAAWNAEGVAHQPLMAAVVGGVVDLVLSAVLVPSQGVEGAVTASVAAGLVYLLWICRAFRGYVPSATYRPFLITVVLACAAGVLVALPLPLFLGQTSPLGVLCPIVAGLVGILIVAVRKPLLDADLALMGAGRQTRLRRVLMSLGSRDRS